MAPRLQLQTLLEELLGSRNVYFQPPPNFMLNYPCIIYKRDSLDRKFANNLPYKDMKRYQVTIIDANPDSEIPDKVAALPMCSFDRFFTANDMNHDVYNLYF